MLAFLYVLIFFLIQYKLRRSCIPTYTYSYERTHAHPTSISIFARLSRQIIFAAPDHNFLRLASTLQLCYHLSNNLVVYPKLVLDFLFPFCIIIVPSSSHKPIHTEKTHLINLALASYCIQ